VTKRVAPSDFVRVISKEYPEDHFDDIFCWQAYCKSSKSNSFNTFSIISRVKRQGFLFIEEYRSDADEDGGVYHARVYRHPDHPDWFLHIANWRLDDKVTRRWKSSVVTVAPDGKQTAVMDFSPSEGVAYTSQ